MAHPMHHAESSAKKFGGKPEDYQAIHNWFDATKEIYADFRHRALRHHSQGIFECERVFGLFIVNSAGKKVPTRFIGEQHVKEDCAAAVSRPSPTGYATSGRSRGCRRATRTTARSISRRSR